MVHYYTHSWTQKTTSSIWTERCNSCIQESFWWSRRCWNLHTSTVIWILGQYPYQHCFKESFAKFSRELIVPNTAIHGPEQYSYYAPRIDFYVVNMNSRSYFKNQFVDTFGSVTYVWEFCGIYFSCFLFIQLIVDLVVMILRHMEINRLTGALLGFGKTLLSASYNLFLASILTSMFNPQAPFLRALAPEPTPTRIEDETRDPVDENKKKEEHLYPFVHCPTRALSPVWLGQYERYPW